MFLVVPELPTYIKGVINLRGKIIPVMDVRVKFKKEENKKYQESVKNMNQDDKKNYDFLLTLQNQFENLTNELHVKLFPEEFDFMLEK